MHFSKADGSSVFHLSKLSLGLDASAEYCMHLRKCFIRSLIAPMIATEASCFAFCASCVATLTISICLTGCLTMFLWSKCLTKIDNKRWEFNPEVNNNKNGKSHYEELLWSKRKGAKVQEAPTSHPFYIGPTGDTVGHKWDTLCGLSNYFINLKQGTHHGHARGTSLKLILVGTRKGRFYNFKNILQRSSTILK